MPDLTRRTKWFVPTEPLKINDIVIVIDETAPKDTWERARITKIYPDGNGQVRWADAVSVTDGKRKFHKRPTSKLAVLDLVN